MLQVRTLGDLRTLLSKELMLPRDRTEVWIAPPATSTNGGGAPPLGLEPSKPLGEKATFDGMSLGHYGLGHLGVVDVRLRPLTAEEASSAAATAAAAAAAAPPSWTPSWKAGSTAAKAGARGAKGGRGGESEKGPCGRKGAGVPAGVPAAAAAAAGERQDVMRIAVRTNVMVLRGDDAVVRTPLLFTSTHLIENVELKHYMANVFGDLCVRDVHVHSPRPSLQSFLPYS